MALRWNIGAREDTDDKKRLIQKSTETERASLMAGKNNKKRRIGVAYGQEQAACGPACHGWTITGNHRPNANVRELEAIAGAAQERLQWNHQTIMKFRQKDPVKVSNVQVRKPGRVR